MRTPLSRSHLLTEDDIPSLCLRTSHRAVLDDRKTSDFSASWLGALLGSLSGMIKEGKMHFLVAWTYNMTTSSRSVVHSTAQ